MNMHPRKTVQIGNCTLGDFHPVCVIAEIGINHNGDVGLAKEMIKTAHIAGANLVKFQKRNPEECVPPSQRNKMRDTPWGYISYIDYRQRVEFGEPEYTEIDRYCRELGIEWLASCWDLSSVEFLERFEPIAYKVPSAHMTNKRLLGALKETGRPLIVSTGMSTQEEICDTMKCLTGGENVALAHCTSTYPTGLHELNLRMIHTLRNMFDCPVGYSGHEVGLATTVAAVALGACFVERHLTLDRSMWGSDQAASVEPVGFARLIKDIRSVEAALGDGKKIVYESEMEARQRLRTCAG
jgi:N-acetylneuraminate synthase